MPGPKPPPVGVTVEERAASERLVRRHTTGQQLAERARIVLLAADGSNNGEVARAVGVDVDTVRRWRGRWGSAEQGSSAELSVAARPAADEPFDAKVTDVCTRYWDAPALAERGERCVRTDELTGVQALERKPPGLPLAPGEVERREFEYRRHGTRPLILSRDVVTGRVLAPHAGPTRPEAAFPAHLRAVVATAPAAARRHVVADNLDAHRPESPARRVAEVPGPGELDPGAEGQAGSLASRETRAASPSDPTHRIVRRCTPEPSSWLNQTEIWLSSLTRKPLRRAPFTSVDDPTSRAPAFIAHYHRTARPFGWTSRGRALMA